MRKLTAKEVAFVVEEAFKRLPSDADSTLDQLMQVIVDHELLPADATIKRERIFHRLRNGKKVYQRTDRGWRCLAADRPEGDDPKGLAPAALKVVDCKSEDFENLIGTLLAESGFKDVRYSTARSCQADRGVDLWADYQEPMGQVVRYHIAATGTRIDGRRIQQARGLPRHGERVLLFVHLVSPRLRRESDNRQYPVRVPIYDATDISSHLDRLGLSVAEAVAKGAAMRQEQYGESAQKQIA